MHWNCTGTLEIRERAPFHTGLPPNKEAKIRSRGGVNFVSRERFHCAVEITTVRIISLDITALLSHKVLHNISF